jgi:glucose/arabinose dehydrogenase
MPPKPPAEPLPGLARPAYGRLTAVLLLALAALGLSAARPAAPAAAFLPPLAPQAAPVVGAVSYLSGFTGPVHIANAGDGSGRLFVVEQRGRIRLIKDDVLQAAPFLDITSRVTGAGGEQGLLSVAFPPDYASSGHFYVYYNNTAGNIVVARYGLTSNPDAADPASEQVILPIAHPTYGNHNGGQMAFGADGYLYIATGDGGGGGDPSNNAQNHNSLLGKILRIDVESGVDPYAVPPSNPYVGVSGYRGEIWALGLRNPWRFSFDRLTHDLYIADVGQGTYEEVDFQPAASPGGENYGWRIMEANACYNPSSCSSAGLTLPVTYYAHSLGCSVTGGMVYRGALFPGLQGYYFYGDYCSGRIWSLIQSGGTWQSELVLDTTFNISTFGEDEQGEVFFANLASGTLYRLVDPAAPCFTLTLSVSPAAAGSAAVTPPTCASGGYAAGTSLHLTARPASGLYRFTGWGGDLTGSTSPTTLVVNADAAVTVGFEAATFSDVPFDHWAHDYVEALWDNNYTAGCGTAPLRYCPDGTMNRGESAVFVVRGVHDAGYLPASPAVQLFSDLDLSSWAAKWADQLFVDGYTAGCGTGPLIFCPWQGHTRAEGSVFYLRMLNGPAFLPPEATAQTFSDVPLDAWYAKWVQAAYDADLIEACATSPSLQFCPDGPLTRGLAAYMMVKAKNLPLP